MRVPLNSQLTVTVESLQDAEDVFEMFRSDGSDEVFGVYDACQRLVKLIKNVPTEPVVIEFDDAPLDTSKLKTTHSVDLTDL